MEAHRTLAEHSLVARWRELLAVYLELAKARLATMVVVTAAVGYLLAARGSTRPFVLLWAVLGTALTAFGANILNQWWETDRDRRMQRTRQRPLPAGRISRRRAARWGIVSAAVGVTVLSVGTTPLTAALGLGNLLLYVLVYTPLKVRTPLNTVVGAVCGAVPPMMGWAAATGRLEAGALVLGSVLFVWQVPHFLALAWLYREDYARGGFRMLPSVDPTGRITGRTAAVYAAALLPLCAAAAWAGVSGTTFLVLSLGMTVLFAVQALRLAASQSVAAARRLFLASILYLPVLLGVMVADMDDRVRAGAFFGRQPETRAVASASPSPPAPAGAMPAAWDR